MAFVAVDGYLSTIAITLYGICVLWIVAFDTLYAMVDKDDDIKLQLKSTAITFGQWDLVIIRFLHGVITLLLLVLGYALSASWLYYSFVMAATGLLIYQNLLLLGREGSRCFKAFLNNHWYGLILLGAFFFI